MSGFCSDQHIFDLIPNRTQNKVKQPETNNNNVSDLITKWANKIKAPKFGIVYPTSEPDPITSTWLLWELLNSFPVAADLYWPIGIAANLEVVRFAEALKKFGADLLKEWTTHQLHYGIYLDRKNKSLPTTALTTIEACCSKSPGFTPISSVGAPEKADLPFLEVIQRLILRATALVRIKAAKWGYYQDNLNEDEASIYSELVAGMVRPFVLAIRAIAQGNYGAVDAFAAHLLAENRRELEVFSTVYNPNIRTKRY